MLKRRTVDWNKDRGLLEKFDPALELKMLSEEVAEFYMADTLAHKFVEYADFIFVFDGTKAKYGCQPIKSTVMFEVSVSSYRVLREWAYDMQNTMYAILEEAVGAAMVDAYINTARNIVVTNNERKSSEKRNGKVVKNKDHIDPADLMGQYFASKGETR